MGTNPYSEQRLLIAHALDAIGDAHFALAGSGAIREHGLITRGTQDVDLFTVAEAIDRFPRAVSTLVDHLSNRGYHVMIRRQNPTFSELAVTTPAGTDLQVDLGIDWRAHAPAHLEIGPVLDLEDAVGNKLAALYSRGYSRDYLDVDAIRSTGIFTDTQLIELLQQRDKGYDREYFTQCLRCARRLTVREVADYGIDATQLREIQRRFVAWADNIDDQRGDMSPGMREVLRVIPHSRLPTRSTPPPMPTHGPTPAQRQPGQGPAL